MLDHKLYENRKQLYIVPPVLTASSPPSRIYFAQYISVEESIL